MEQSFLPGSVLNLYPENLDNGGPTRGTSVSGGCFGFRHAEFAVGNFRFRVVDDDRGQLVRT